MTDQPLEFERYFGFVIALILTSIVADGFGIFLGTLVNPIVSSYFIYMKTTPINSNIELRDSLTPWVSLGGFRKNVPS